ncbi:hypothetical protein PHIM7_263 [Sinorhizobium phage phiM7]|uniref:Uncharacterized protein n=2 Tax=Emdodecavirus TaxID=1980937 RepID=S5MQ81_9CAUD|nr:hypothetical protein AB690_gp246 [Sinorhizobium phage phiM12]YP_009601388.1 hypothetical protein FDH46_gp215 [Sinorhizobium phage phiM7]AGR47980.1 hypothetical protein SmphiM12_348 [Sinorhizobium phage phiM12]AKF12808.1 hypothetical protein PHIM7_263 [Sinorhizobium phage phiM7]AKF13168.1 hypothetical protein PHIM19_263 [Sinorhizobium phage phiM19]
MSLYLHNRVLIYRTNNPELDGFYGKITGLAVDGYIKIWIVTLDVALKDRTTTVALPELCLTVSPDRYPPYPDYDKTVPTSPNYPLPAYPATKEHEDWWDQFQRDAWKDPNPIVGQCSKCKRDIRHIEFFSCATYDCPIQPKAWF